MEIKFEYVAQGVAKFVDEPNSTTIVISGNEVPSYVKDIEKRMSLTNNEIDTILHMRKNPELRLIAP